MKNRIFHNGLEEQFDGVASADFCRHVDLHGKGMCKGVLLDPNIVIQQPQLHVDGDETLGVGEGIFHQVD